MSVQNILQELITRFRDNQSEYRSPPYKEFRLRKEFVDPLFECLGWDMANKGGYSEAYKDVVHEEALKIGKTTKSPDYAFRIGGTTKFFVETKPPSVNVRSDSEPAYQLRRYGWSAKLALSVLTNFCDFAVYDCRIKPNTLDSASVGRVLVLNFEDYLHRWSEIAGVFGRESILKGSFDRYARDATKKRGTSEVDSAFLEEIEGWRESLARNVALRNPELSVRDLNEAVQRTIDRIIFLRIAEDRAIEPYGRLRDIAKETGIYEKLARMYRQADDRYNSGLFHFRRGDGSAETLDTFTLGLNIDDRILKRILTRLYYPESPYEFSVLPIDILGQVYEQFLGKVITLRGRSAIVVDKPEVKKAGGVYYTPNHVVRYIVQEAIGPRLLGRTPEQIGGRRVNDSPDSPFTILDPACGSGSFLIEAYQLLLDWYRDRYIEAGPEKYARGLKPKLYRTSVNGWHLTIGEKRRILLTHIFGVDVDAQAVEVTKLSLLLKVLEGESSDAIARQMDLFHIRALPDLGDNIQCGNSIIESSLYKYYQEDLFSLDQKMTINPFDWNTRFKFLRKAGGFDIVIGNPPYLYSAGQEYEEYFLDRYSYAQYQTDFYVYFIERAISLTRPLGSISFIIPDSWLNSESFSRIRDFMLTDNRLERITVFRYFVFRGANVENTIFLLKKGGTSRSREIEVKFSHRAGQYVEKSRLRYADVKRLGIINPFYSPESEVVLQKLEAAPALRGRYEINRGIHAYRTDGYGESKFGRGAQTNRDKEERSYHSKTRRDTTYLPEVRGRDVGWLRYEGSGEFVSYGKWLAEPREPKFITSKKVIARKTLGNILSCAFVEEPAAIDQSLYIIISKTNDTGDLKHLLGILASDVAAWYLRTKFAIYDLLHPWYSKKQLEELPVPTQQGHIVADVERLEGAIFAHAAARIETERRMRSDEISRARLALNEHVFELYGLTRDDVAVIRRSNMFAEIDSLDPSEKADG
ncbi:MAG TPA: N-6 DNA methylase [Rhizomicrobium sp.]|jgi:hypothetical protein